MLRELNIQEMEMVSGGYNSFLLLHKDAMPGGTTGDAIFDAQVENTEQLEWAVFGDLPAGLASGNIVRVCTPNAPQRSGFSDWSDYDAFLRENSYGGRSLRSGDGGSMVAGAALNRLEPGCPNWPSTARSELND